MFHCLLNQIDGFTTSVAANSHPEEVEEAREHFILKTFTKVRELNCRFLVSAQCIPYSQVVLNWGHELRRLS